MKKVLLWFAITVLCVATVLLSSCDLFQDNDRDDDDDIRNDTTESADNTTKPSVTTDEGSSNTDAPECAHESTYVWPGKAPTCTENGYTEYEVCNSCGKYIREKTPIPITDHEYNEDGICGGCYYVRGLEWYDESKTEYIIKTADEFIDFRNLVNRKMIYFEGVTVKLGADIDLGGIEWQPISVFKGTFDGEHHSIKNFKLTNGDLQYAGIFGRNEGTIKSLAIEEYIINIEKTDENPILAGSLVAENSGHIEFCTASSEHTVSISGAKRMCVGGLIGQNFDVVYFSSCNTDINVLSKCDKWAYECAAGGLIGYVYSGVVNLSYATGSVTLTSGGAKAYAGGLVGFGGMSGSSVGYISSYAEGNVKNIYTKPTDSGYITSETLRTGGLIGYIQVNGIIVKSYATGDVVSECTDKPIYTSHSGGLIGSSFREQMIFECYATGDVVSGKSAIQSYAAGLVGHHCGGIIKDSFSTGSVFAEIKNSTGKISVDYFMCCPDVVGTVENCYVSSSSTVTKKIAASSESIYETRYASKTKDSNFKSTWIFDNLFRTENEVWGLNGGYPTVESIYITEAVKIISTAAELRALQGKILVRNYELASDINLSGSSWTPIVACLGSFDGGEHSVTNFKCGSIVGFYGQRISGFIVYNLGVLKDITVKNAQYEDVNYVGGLAVYNVCGTVDNCHADIELTTSKGSIVGILICESYSGKITSSDAKGRITSTGSNAYIGGLVGCVNSSGRNPVIIENCHTDVEIDANCTEDKEIYVGGIVGLSYGADIRNSSVIADIYFYSSFGGGCFGGLIGYGDVATVIIESYANGNIIAKGKLQICAGGLVGSGDITVENSYFTGKVDALSVTDTCCVGGIIGSAVSVSDESRISSSYAKGELKAVSNLGVSYAGGIVGLNDAKEKLTLLDCLAICSVEGTNGGYAVGSSCGTVMDNTYCYDGVQITATSVCTEGIAAGGDKINSSDFYKNTLKWSDEIWQIADNEVPILK